MKGAVSRTTEDHAPGVPQQHVGKPPIPLRLVHPAIGLHALDDVSGKRHHQGLAPLADGANRMAANGSSR